MFAQGPPGLSASRPCPRAMYRAQVGDPPAAARHVAVSIGATRRPFRHTLPSCRCSRSVVRAAAARRRGDADVAPDASLRRAAGTSNSRRCDSRRRGARLRVGWRTARRTTCSSSTARSSPRTGDSGCRRRAREPSSTRGRGFGVDPSPQRRGREFRAYRWPAVTRRMFSLAPEDATRFHVARDDGRRRRDAGVRVWIRPIRCSARKTGILARAERSGEREASRVTKLHVFIVASVPERRRRTRALELQVAHVAARSRGSRAFGASRLRCRRYSSSSRAVDVPVVVVGVVLRDRFGSLQAAQLEVERDLRVT